MIKSKLVIKETEESLLITTKEDTPVVLEKAEMPVFKAAPEAPISVPVVVVEAVIVPVPVAEAKVYEKPLLMIEEVARKFKQFKPHHLPSLISFCRSRGHAMIGTEVELIGTLKAFGWHT